MAFYPIVVKGRTVAQPYTKTASTAIVNGALVVLSSGALIPATSSTANIVGLAGRAVAATDADYAVANTMTVIVPTDETVVKMLYTGSAPTVGVQYDLSNSYTVNTGATTYKVVTCVGEVNTTDTTANFVINGRLSDLNIAT